MKDFFEDSFSCLALSYHNFDNLLLLFFSFLLAVLELQRCHSRMCTLRQLWSYTLIDLMVHMDVTLFDI